MTIPDYIISRTTFEDYRHKHAERPLAGDPTAPRRRRHESGGTLAGIRHRLSAALHSVAERIEPQPAGSR